MKRLLPPCLQDSSESAQTVAELMPEPTMAEFLADPRFVPPPNIGQRDREPLIEMIKRLRESASRALDSWHEILDSPDLTDEMATIAHELLHYYFERNGYIEKLILLAEYEGSIVTVRDEDKDANVTETDEPRPNCRDAVVNLDLAGGRISEVPAERVREVEWDLDESPTEWEDAIVRDLLAEPDMSDFCFF